MVIPEVRQERLYQKIANLIIKLINDNIFPRELFTARTRTGKTAWREPRLLARSPYCTGDLGMDRDSVR